MSTVGDDVTLAEMTAPFITPGDRVKVVPAARVTPDVFGFTTDATEADADARVAYLVEPDDGDGLLDATEADADADNGDGLLDGASAFLLRVADLGGGPIVGRAMQETRDRANGVG